MEWVCQLGDLGQGQQGHHGGEGGCGGQPEGGDGVAHAGHGGHHQQEQVGHNGLLQLPHQVEDQLHTTLPGLCRLAGRQQGHHQPVQSSFGGKVHWQGAPFLSIR